MIPLIIDVSYDLIQSIYNIGRKFYYNEYINYETIININGKGES